MKRLKACSPPHDRGGAASVEPTAIRLTLNGIEKDLTDDAWSDLNGVVPGAFGAVEGTNALVVFDDAGNATTVTFMLDATPPTVAVKDDAGFTDAVNAKKDKYRMVSFALSDAGGLDRVEVNGVATELFGEASSDLDHVTVGTLGAVKGANTLTVYDVAGNATDYAFILKH